MIVCHCKGITDRELIRLAARGARTSADVTRECGAGQECGGCLIALHRVLSRREDRASRAPAAPLPTSST